MAYEQRENTGALFKNERKEKDSHADYRGNALIDGVEYWLDAWINEDRNGAKYMSLKLKRKDGSGHSQQQAPARADLDDSVPF